VKDAETSADFELLKPIINENVQLILKENLKNNNSLKFTSEKSMPTAVFDRSEGIESRNHQLIRNDSQETYEQNYIQQTETSENQKYNEARGSVIQEYMASSPILNKNSVHQMSNNSTVIPSSIKKELLQMGVLKENLLNISPSNPRDLNNSVELTDDVQNTQRSDELLNTSTDIELSQRYSVYQVGSLQKSSRKQGNHNRNHQNLAKISQQPGFIDKDQAIIEAPNRDEIASNSKSREQSNQRNTRQKFKNSSVLCNNFNSAQDENASLMRSRYLEQEEHKLDDYDMYENSERQNPSPLPSCRL